MARFRHELKYLINYGEYEALNMRLSKILSLDPNAVGGDYTIRSLYFDDLNNSAYEEKEMGIFFRKKYRIRIYNYSDKSIKLERKLKQGQYIYKEAATLTRDETEKIIRGDYGFLLTNEQNLCREFYYECISNFMRPKVIVDYERTPLVMDEGTVRITFDKNLRAAADTFDIFDEGLPAFNIFNEQKLILEVKYTEFLPKLVKDVLPPASSEFTAASKYTMCRDRMDGVLVNNYCANYEN